ncbi:alkane hydroxylase MAH1-like [Euphorbia lathyris]|uniref:alkane hydroxylase MAH1-like n=1 Tax=Euphorbia lathyris TaxID=212925 RepID=UPI003313B53E
MKENIIRKEKIEMVYFEIAAAFVSIVVVWVWWSSRNSLVTDWPVVGMVPALLYNASQIHDFATCLLQQNNGTFLVKAPWFSSMAFLLTSDPMNVHHTFSKNFSNYPKGSDFNDIFNYLGDGIFTVDSDSWKIQRNMIHSLLKDKRFELAVHTSLHQKISKCLFSVLDNACKLGIELDLKDMFQRFTFDHICILLFGMDPDTLSMESPTAPQKAFDDIAQVFFYRHIVPGVIWKLQRWLQIGQEKKMTKASHTFDIFVENCIQKNQQKEKNNNEFDALTYFLQLEDQKDNLSSKFIRDMAVNLMVAGRDTTSAALFWTFWLISTNPSSQNNILEEMEQHFGTHNDDNKLNFLDMEKMGKLVYLHGVICEALRFYPSVPFERKVSIESDILPSGHHISKNTRIVYSLYAMGRMKEIWGEDCLEFKPERWISESGGIKHQPSYKFTAFNAGPRTCLGKNLAFLQIKSIVCAILWNYSLHFTKDQNVCPSSSILLHPKNGFKVTFFKRHPS